MKTSEKVILSIAERFPFKGKVSKDNKTGIVTVTQSGWFSK